MHKHIRYNAFYVILLKKGGNNMKQINWAKKLTSRKWWTSVASFVTLMIVACGGADSTATQVSAIIMAGAVVIGYTIGEGLTDSANVDTEISTEINVEESKEA